MKITKRELKRLIQESVKSVVEESTKTNSLENEIKAINSVMNQMYQLTDELDKANIYGLDIIDGHLEPTTQKHPRVVESLNLNLALTVDDKKNIDSVLNDVKDYLDSNFKTLYISQKPFISGDTIYLIITSK